MMSRRGVLFALTVLTLCHAGAMHWAFYASHLGARVPLWSLSTWAGGLWYALPMIGILGAHEGAHWALCRRFGLRTTGPYVLPFGLPMVGTFGAFLRVHDPFPSRRVLFWVAWSGPLAGFVASVVALLVGAWWTFHDPYPVGVAFGRFGTPPLIDLVRGTTGILHPVVLAAWIGLVVTGLNLLPYGSFDGGAMMTALVGREWALVVSVLTMIGVASLMLHSMVACAVAVVMVVMGWHGPSVTDGGPRTGWPEWAAAASAVVVAWSCLG